MRIFWLAPIQLGLLLVLAVDANAQCAEPIASPSDATSIDAWKDVIYRSVSKLDNPAINARQYLDWDGAGNLHLDYYSLTVDANGQSAVELLAQFRSNFQAYLTSSDFYWVEPLDYDSKLKWNSGGTPVGAVLVFALPGHLPAEYKLAALVVNCYDSKKSMRMGHTAIQQVPHDSGGLLSGRRVGLHPLFGNRAIGVQTNSDGSLTLYMKAALRRNGLDLRYDAKMEDRLFRLESRLWRESMQQLAKSLADRRPRQIVSYERTVPFVPRVAP